MYIICFPRYNNHAKTRACALNSHTLASLRACSRQPLQQPLFQKSFHNSPEHTP